MENRKARFCMAAISIQLVKVNAMRFRSIGFGTVLDHARQLLCDLRYIDYVITGCAELNAVIALSRCRVLN
eukprot:2995252-Amphidinium_carterae.2